MFEDAAGDREKGNLTDVGEKARLCGQENDVAPNRAFAPDVLDEETAGLVPDHQPAGLRDEGIELGKNRRLQFDHVLDAQVRFCQRLDFGNRAQDAGLRSAKGGKSHAEHQNCRKKNAHLMYFNINHLRCRYCPNGYLSIPPKVGYNNVIYLGGACPVRAIFGLSVQNKNGTKKGSQQ